MTTRIRFATIAATVACVATSLLALPHRASAEVSSKLGSAVCADTTFDLVVIRLTSNGPRFLRAVTNTLPACITSHGPIPPKSLVPHDGSAFAKARTLPLTFACQDGSQIDNQDFFVQIDPDGEQVGPQFDRLDASVQRSDREVTLDVDQIEGGDEGQTMVVKARGGFTQTIDPAWQASCNAGFPAPAAPGKPAVPNSVPDNTIVGEWRGEFVFVDPAVGADDLVPGASAQASTKGVPPAGINGAASAGITPIR